jgi:hypothetical protein
MEDIGGFPALLFVAPALFWKWRNQPPHKHIHTYTFTHSFDFKKEILGVGHRDPTSSPGKSVNPQTIPAALLPHNKIFTELRTVLY